jgi:Winged helix DNA-binding domain
VRRHRHPVPVTAAPSRQCRAFSRILRTLAARDHVDEQGGRVAAGRLAAQEISRHSFSAPADVVAWLGAMQAQDYAAAKWAVGLRLPEGAATDGTIEAALAQGTVIRTHALRSTWQLVAPEDVRWMVALVAPRLVVRLATRHRQLDLDAATFRRSHAVLEKALGDGGHRTRHELAIVLERAGVSTTGQRLAHLLGRAELEGLICGGARRGKQLTYVLLDRRVPRQRGLLARDEALAELARRYFRSRGPATVADFSWWSGLAPSDARAGLASIQSTLVADVVGGQTWWRSNERAGAAPAAGAYFLPAFDEYLVGYRNRDAVLDPKHVTRLNAGGGMLDPCVVLDGRVVGTWRRTLGRATVAIELDLFVKLSPRQHQTVSAAACRYGQFLGLEAQLDRSGRPIRRRPSG